MYFTNWGKWVRIWLVPSSKALYHTCFICGQRCKWSSHQLKWASSVISNAKLINFLFTFQDLAAMMGFYFKFFYLYSGLLGWGSIAYYMAFRYCTLHLYPYIYNLNAHSVSYCLFERGTETWWFDICVDASSSTSSSLPLGSGVCDSW